MNLRFILDLILTQPPFEFPQANLNKQFKLGSLQNYQAKIVIVELIQFQLNLSKGFKHQ